MTPSFRELDPARDEAALVELLTSETWPHRVKPVLTEADVRGELAGGRYAGEHALAFLIELDGAVAGLVAADDLGNERSDPQLDFRVRERLRGRGLGLAALEHITRAIFERDPRAFRIEGQTRQDNVAMRKVFVRGGYVKEAVFRSAWPGADGRLFDGIGYAMLRRDWETGTTTPVVWDEP